MPLLNVTNLTTHDMPFQDVSGQSNLSFVVPASGSKNGIVLTIEQMEVLEPLLVAEATASNITWTVSDNPASLADSLPGKVRTALLTPDTVAVGDDIIVTNLTSPGAVSVVLPAAASIGKEMLVVDGKGDAGSNNVTVTVASAGTINGSSSFVLNSNKTAVRLIKVGASAWVGFAMGSMTAASIGTDAVNGTMILSTEFLRFFPLTGADASGGATHVTSTGSKIGDKVLTVFNVTDTTEVKGDFEATVTVNDQVQQTSVNLSAKKLLIVLLARS